MHQMKLGFSKSSDVPGLASATSTPIIAQVCHHSADSSCSAIAGPTVARIVYVAQIAQSVFTLDMLVTLVL